MTLRSRLLALFPALVIALSCGAALWLALSRSLFALLALVLTPYLVPLVCFRVHELLQPCREGSFNLRARRYPAWWGAHQLQRLFVEVPLLEAVLRLVPGLFSLWLRLWGSRIGRRVYWPPGLVIGDRSLLEIGDDVIFGFGVGMSGHVVQPTRRRLLLLVKRVRIGEGAFVGAGAVIAPGARIEKGAFVPAGGVVHLHELVEARR